MVSSKQEDPVRVPTHRARYNRANGSKKKNGDVRTEEGGGGQKSIEPDRKWKRREKEIKQREWARVQQLHSLDFKRKQSCKCL